MKVLFASFLLCSVCCLSWAQCPGWTGFQVETDTFYNNPFLGITVSARLDRLGRDYVYAGAKTDGLEVYDISQNDPQQVAQVPRNQVGNLDVLNLHQEGTVLYACLGGFWSHTPGQRQQSGLAAYDVSNPANPALLDYYVYPGDSHGAAALTVRDSLAFLAAMENGLIILNVADPTNIQLVSRLEFADSFPHVQYHGNDSSYNARGIALKDDLAYVCYDRGALRVVDFSDPANPMQISQYVYPPLIDHATAYNAVTIHDTLAFVTLDYYGMEILNISDPYDIQQVAYWRPASWPAATNNFFVWAGAKGHTNEVVYHEACERVYVSAGKSDAVAISVANPAQPDSCDTFGDETDNYATWGIDLFQDRVVLSYIYAPFPPLYAFWNGFRVMKAPDCTTSGIPRPANDPLCRVYPNPFQDQVHLELTGPVHHLEIEILDCQGRSLYRSGHQGQKALSIRPDLPSGAYLLMLTADGKRDFERIVKW